jgi:hypothetical protein
MGGYREGSGRSKSGYYKGIYCGSTYELCWLIHAIDHDVKFQRFPKMLEHRGKKYMPDFLVGDDLIIELKGYEKEEVVSAKTAVAVYHGYTVKVLRKDDLKDIFNYVREKYGTSEFYKLYDEYKPKYVYTCAHCQSSITTDKKRKTMEVFCSRVCAGKATRTNAKEIENAQYKRSFSKDEALTIFYDESASLAKLAEKYKTTKNSVWFIKSKRSYKWIHD